MGTILMLLMGVLLADAVAHPGSPISSAELMLVAQGVLGYIWQWTRAPKKIPNGVSYAIFGVAAAVAYVYATPTFGDTFQGNWRTAIAGLVSFVMSARGFASGSSDAGLAAKTNTL